MRTLVLGMGNPILGDDAVGILLARDLHARIGEMPGVDFVEECCVGGLNLLDQVAGYERLIVIDSIKTQGGHPGTWYRFDASSLRETMNLRNVHDTNFATALELGRIIGMVVPDDAENHIFAVEIAVNDTFAEELSRPLADAYPELVEEIIGEICELLGLRAQAPPHEDTEVPESRSGTR
jgi:hydrogenase maturation protease